MATLAFHKPIWSEGLLIGPQHFQQADRCHEALLDVRVRQLVPFGWGTVALAINAGALEHSGLFMLERYRGVFPSGTSVSIPDGDPAPAAREVPPHAFSSDRLGVYLALPADRPRALNYATGATTRYVPECVDVVDECSGEDDRELVMARKNLRILFEGEPADGLERLKIAELQRATDGRLALREEYIPPCLALAAAPHLLRLTDDLIGELTATSAAVYGVQQQRSAERYEFRNADADLLWLLSVLNASIPLLAHHCRARQVHPEVLYRDLLQLAGQLTALAVQVRAADLPPYDHDDLAGCMTRLGEAIAALLRTAIGSPIRITSLRLEEATSAADYAVLRTPAAVDAFLFAPDSRFYLLVRATAADLTRQEALQRLFPDLVAFLDEAVTRSAWVERAEWPLLQYRHYRTHRAGAQFFEQLRALLGGALLGQPADGARPARYDAAVWTDPARAGVLEVYYTCLLLGFTGELRTAPPEDYQRQMDQVRAHLLLKPVGALAPHLLPPAPTPIAGGPSRWVWGAAGLYGLAIVAIILIFLTATVHG
jgi:type VI secretion system protein ImpJ